MSLFISTAAKARGHSALIENYVRFRTEKRVLATIQGKIRDKTHL